MLIGIVTHTDRTIGQVAKYAAAILAGNDRQAPGADRMALLRPSKGLDSISLIEISSLSFSLSYAFTTQSSVWPGWYSVRRSEIAV